ncbi:MAG: transposase [Thermodesulfobacteriota bacterium]
MKKGDQPRYDYKVPRATEALEGFILVGRLTPANRADVVELEYVLDEVDLPPEAVVLADKGYAAGRPER